MCEEERGRERHVALPEIVRMTGKRWSSRLRGTVLRPLRSPSRRAGDQARDAHRWAEAAEHYAHHLETRPGDLGIWVQRGNCLKEVGRYEDALAAYGEAIALNDGDADVHLQKGHLLKVMGWRAGAIEAYRRSLSLRPKNNPALQELVGLGAQDAIGSVFTDGIHAATTTIFLDFTDLVIYLRHNESLSGIQRVVANLLMQAQSFTNRTPGRECSIIPVLPDYHRLILSSVHIGLVDALLDTMASRKSREVIDAILDSIDQSKVQVEARPGDSFVISGAFWIYERYDLLNRLRLSGVHVSIYIHDLIQITNPEYVAQDATNAFRRSLVDVLSVSSYVMTNSDFVGSEVKRYLQER